MRVCQAAPEHDDHLGAHGARTHRPPLKDQLGHASERGLDEPARTLYFDISWDEVAKYVVASPEAITGAWPI